MRWMFKVGLVLAGCAGEGGTNEGGADTDTDIESSPGPAAQTDCSDPAGNPWAGTCVETYLEDCFDPVGSCTGDISMTGSSLFEWENGASVSTEVDASSPMNPMVITELVASDGTLCATAQSESQAGGCFSRTTYRRTADGAQQIWCIEADSSIEVTCDDGSTVGATAAESEAASECQYGSEAEPCETNAPQR